MNVEVKRSAWRMWLMAIGGIPLLVISLDVLTNRKLTNQLREMLFRPDDTQIYEPRDVIWAWAMLLFGIVVVAWGLKELFFPTRVIEGRFNGLAVKLRGPFQQPDLIPWDDLKDVSTTEVEDEDVVLKLLTVEVAERRGLPAHPWGARWLDKNLLGILTQDWSVDPDQVADEIGDYAVEAVRTERLATESSTREES